MFLMRRPSGATIERFLDESRALPLSYEPIGLAQSDRPGLDEALVAIGCGREAFERARAALMAWRQFELGWVELFPRNASVEVGTVVAVLIRHLGFWSLNGCRVVYGVGKRDPGSRGDRFGYAYGALTNHAEAGEELFEVFYNPESDEVMYRIRATSRPQAALARLGQPVVRLLQARFRRDSVEAMRRATSRAGRPRATTSR